MEQYDQFFSNAMTESVQGAERAILAATPSLKPSMEWNWKWVVGAGVVVLLLLALFFTRVNKTNGKPVAQKEVVESFQLPKVLPRFGDLQEVAVLEPKAVPAAPKPQMHQVQEAQVTIPSDPSMLAKQVGLDLKQLLFRYKIPASKVATIVSHTVKELLTEDKNTTTAPILQRALPVMQPKAVGSPSVESPIAPLGVMSLVGKQLPIARREYEQESGSAGSKDGKLNAETDPRILNMMKSRGLSPQQS